MTDQRADASEARADAAEVTVDALRLEIAGLRDGTEHLAGQVASLSHALTVMNDLQAAQTATQQRVEAVEESSVTKKDLATVRRKQDAEALHFRKLALQRIYMTALVLLTLFIVGTLGLLAMQDSRRDATKRICESRSAELEVIEDVLESSAQGAPPGPRTDFLRDSIRRFEALRADCEIL